MVVPVLKHIGWIRIKFLVSSLAISLFRNKLRNISPYSCSPPRCMIRYSTGPIPLDITCNLD